MKAVAIIQARMTSSRFPGKVLRALAGQPLLWHIVTRVAHAAEVAQVVVACSVRPEDEAIAEFCRANGLPCVRGPETDVLERFRLALEQFPADIVVRICGDSPLVAPEWIDHCVTTLRTSGADYTTLPAGRHCRHEGVDVLTRTAFDRLVQIAGTHPAAREHLTGYFKLTPGSARAAEVPLRPGEEGQARLSIDVPEDLAFFERLYVASGASAGELTLAQAFAVLDRHPDIRRLNDGVQRRRVDEPAAKVYLYGEGGTEMGWGHISRLTVLAQSLRRAGASVFIGYEGDAQVAQHWERLDLRGRAWPGVHSRGAWLARELAETEADVFLADTCGRLMVEDLHSVRQAGPPVLLLDNAGERTLLADAVYNPPAPQSAHAPPGFRGTWEAGWHCVPLREDFLAENPAPTGRVLLVTMGGSDPRNFTLRALRALRKLPALSGWTVRVVLGASYPHRVAVERELADTPLRCELSGPTQRMAEEMVAASAVLLSFGVTAYEAAALGRRMACYCLTEDHRRHAGVFSRAGLATLLDDTPGTDAARLADWLVQPAKPAAPDVRGTLRAGTEFLTAEILRHAAKHRTQPVRAAA